MKNMYFLNDYAKYTYVLGPANLTRIARDQSFYVWLVVWDMTLQKAYILKTIMWNMQLQIDVDPNKPLGEYSV